MASSYLSRRRFLATTATALGSLALFGLTGCGSSGSSGADGAKQEIKIACIAREEPEITWVGEQLADKYSIKAQVFSDNASVNESVRDGSCAGNYFQNAAYLDNWNKAKGADLVVYGDGIFDMPYVIMSKNIKSLDAIPSGATILISSDASGLATELRVLQKAGLITLNDSSAPTQYDVIDNPHNLDFVLVEPRSRVGMYDDADLMLTQSMNVVLMNREDANIDDALYVEDLSDRDPYQADIIFTVSKETADEKPQWLVDVDERFHSDDFKQFLEDTYGNGKVAAF